MLQHFFLIRGFPQKTLSSCSTLTCTHHCLFMLPLHFHFFSNRCFSSKKDLSSCAALTCAHHCLSLLLCFIIPFLFEAFLLKTLPSSASSFLFCLRLYLKKPFPFVLTSLVPTIACPLYLCFLIPFPFEAFLLKTLPSCASSSLFCLRLSL